MLSSADENVHGLAVEIPTNHREIPGSTPGRYNLQIEITSSATISYHGIVLYSFFPPCSDVLKGVNKSLNIYICTHVCLYTYRVVPGSRNWQVETALEFWPVSCTIFRNLLAGISGSFLRFIETGFRNWLAAFL